MEIHEAVYCNLVLLNGGKRTSGQFGCICIVDVFSGGCDRPNGGGMSGVY